MTRDRYYNMGCDGVLRRGLTVSPISGYPYLVCPSLPPSLPLSITLPPSLSLHHSPSLLPISYLVPHSLLEYST